MELTTVSFVEHQTSGRQEVWGTRDASLLMLLPGACTCCPACTCCSCCSFTCTSCAAIHGPLVWGPEELEINPKRAAALEKSHPGAKVPPHVGKGAVLVEPGGSQFGLMELSPETHGHFKLR